VYVELLHLCGVKSAPNKGVEFMHYLLRRDATASSRDRMRIVALLLLLLISSLAGCANSQTTPTAGKVCSFTSRTRVVVFRPGIGQWAIAAFGQARPGNEFYYNNQLYRVTDSDKAQVVPFVDAAKLFEADRPSDSASRRPASGDVVQILGEDTRPVSHALYARVKPGTTIRFQGIAYTISSKGIGHVYSSATSSLQRIEITSSAWQHVTNRHTPGGTQNAGASIFNPGVDIRALIKDAELITPVLESNGYVGREFDAGRIIGYEGSKQTTKYRVIATQSGKLVTAYPVVQ